MDDTLREAVRKKLDIDADEEQFIKAFRRVFGIKPDIQDRDGVHFRAHDETWSLDGEGYLLYVDHAHDEYGYIRATPELFKDKL